MTALSFVIAGSALAIGIFVGYSIKMDVFGIGGAVTILIISFATLLLGNLLLAIFEAVLLCALLLSSILYLIWETKDKGDL